MTPPSDEAVKAAFAICEYDLDNRSTWEACDDGEKFLWSMPNRTPGENPLSTAARILAAHARAKEAASQKTLAERCYDQDKASDELFDKINSILGCDVSKCCDEGFVFAVHDCWTDDYDQSVEVIRDSEWPPLTREQADQILAFGFSFIYESYGAETCHGWTKATRYEKYTVGNSVRDNMTRIRAERSRLKSEVERLRAALARVIPAMESGLENTRELLAQHDHALGRTTHKNEGTAKIYEGEIQGIGDALKSAREALAGKGEGS